MQYGKHSKLGATLLEVRADGEWRQKSPIYRPPLWQLKITTRSDP